MTRVRVMEHNNVVYNESRRFSKKAMAAEWGKREWQDDS